MDGPSKRIAENVREGYTLTVEASVRFGQFSFDPASMQLTRDGAVVSLGTRGGALLKALLDAQGNVVAKDSLLDAAWPGMTVEESNLAVQIAALRKTLGEQQSGQEWIVTVPRLGYRLPLASSRPLDSDGYRLTLVVLPFQNLGPDAEQQYFADGIVEDIITALSRFKTFAVVSRNSSSAYKGRSVDVRQVGRELGVRYVLEGSVRAGPSRVRVTAQLVDAETGLHIWGDRFEDERANVFDVQDQITDAVVGAIQPGIRRAEVERARLKRTTNPSAYELYLQALPHSFFRNGRRGTELLEEALKLDPDFALAAAIAAEQYIASYFHQAPGASTADLERGIELLNRVLPVCGDDPTLLSMCGLMLCQIKDYDRSLELALKAVKDNPNDSPALGNAGVVCLFAGDLKEAAKHQLRALSLSPNEYWSHAQITCVSHIRMAEAAFEEALQWAERSLAVSPHYTPTYWMLVAGNAHLGRVDEARSFLRDLLEINPALTVSRLRLGQHARDMRRVEVIFDGLRLAGMPEA